MTAPRALEAYAEALRDARGLISVAARRLGVTRQAVHRRVNQHPTLAAVRDEAREEILDSAESALYEAIRRGEGWAVMLCLKSLGRDRGYGERRASAVAVAGDVRIRIEAVDDRRDPALG